MTPRPVGGRGRAALPYLGVVPFLVFVFTFLLYPTVIVAGGAFQSDSGAFTLANIRTAVEPGPYRDSLIRSLELSASTAVLGAVLGAFVAYAVVTGNPDGLLRRTVTAFSGVLAQFGGVMLALAFIATFGFTGLVTVFLKEKAGIDILAHGVWPYEMTGLNVVYGYFQIPLMVLVFLPALDGVRPQWREAAESVGATTWQYWRHVAGPLLLPAFLGSTLLLFANAFSSYATAAALISQGRIILPLQIDGALTSEVVLNQANLAKALALTMVVVVAIVMTLYAILQRRTSRWLQ